MIKFKTFILILFLFSLTILTSGCIQITGGKKTNVGAVDGGIYKTGDKGTTWKQKVLVPTIAGNKNFATINIASVAIDPNDEKAIYYGSIGSGLLYTYDGGNSWTKAAGLGNTSIRSVVVDPGDKCTIFAAIGNKLYRSVDCNRTWLQVYYDNELTTTVNAVAVDHYDSNIVYIGLSRGDLVKSYDGGDSWQTIYRIKDRINKIIIDPNDSRNLYLIMGKRGIFRTTDGGANWTDFNGILNELKLGLSVKDLTLVASEPNTIFIATSYGLLKSADQGENWNQIKLIPPDKKATINALAVNPVNSQEIYYVTNTVFYRTPDGGENWTPIKLPTSRAGWKLIVDPENPQVIYMGVRSLKK